MYRQWQLMLALAVLLIVTAMLWRLSSSADYQLFGELHARVDINEPLIALTFDDGPVPGKTEQILQILADAAIPATFFLVGKDVAAAPELVHKILAAGHQIGNHSYQHQRLMFKSPCRITSEIEQTDALLRANQVDGVIYFRPPYGKKLVLLPWYLMQHHRVSITWDVAPENFPDIARDKQKLVAHTIAQTKAGSIILLHVMYDSRAATMQAVPEIIAGLKARGFRFVTVHQLLQAAGKT